MKYSILWIGFLQRLRQLKAGLVILFCRLAGPVIAARMLAKMVNREGYVAGRKTVFCLYRPLFSKDIDQLRLRTDMNWIHLNNELIGIVQSAWTLPEMRRQTSFQQCSGEKYDKHWEKLERFGLSLIEAMKRHLAVDAILAAHIDYWQSEGVRRGGRKLGIPFLVLCREHATLQMQQTTLREYYSRFRFEGDGVAVFGKSMHDIFINSGACKPEQVFITGPPRLDIWRDLNNKQTECNKIVLLSFRDAAYLAKNTFEEVLKRFVDSAEKSEGKHKYAYVVKAKNREDAESILSMIKSSSDNLSIQYDTPLYDLLPQSLAVVGFNSLSLVEALFTRAKIVVPHWGEARRPPAELTANPENPAIARAIKFAENPEEMQKEMDNADEPFSFSEKELEIRRKAIRQYFHIEERMTCSEAVETFVHYFINKKANASNRYVNQNNRTVER